MGNKLDTKNLEKALSSLDRALQITPVDDIVRDAVFQRFEYSYELCWKFMKRYLRDHAGIEEHQIKEIYRQSAKVGLINNPQNWFDYHKARNLTSHTYNEQVADETFQYALAFFNDANEFLNQLKKLL